MHRLLPFLLCFLCFSLLARGQGAMVIITQPGESITGHSIAGPPTIEVRDEDDNPVGEGTEVTVAINKNSFSHGTSTIETNIFGIAVFDDLVTDIADTGYQLIFSSAGLSDVTSNTFDVYEELFKITITNQPVNGVPEQTIEGADIINPVSVFITDMDDNPVTSGTINVALNKGSFTSESTVSASISNGLAVFDNLIINTEDTGYQLIFLNPSNHIADAVSDPFDVVAETASMKIFVNTEESIESIPLYGPPTIYVEESGIPQQGIEISAYLNKNDFSAESTVNAVTDENGLAEFNNLLIADRDNDYRIFFNATPSGIAGISSDLFDVVEEVALMEVIQQPELTIAGQVLNGPPTVFIKDKETEDPLLSQITVTLSNNDFNAVSTKQITTVDGIAVFNNLIIDEPGDYTLIFSVEGTSGVDTLHSNQFTVLPVSGNITVTMQPLETVAGYPIEGQPTIQILDPDLTPIENIEVTAVINKNSFTGGTTTKITNEEGIIVFDDLILSDPDTGYELNFIVEVSEGIPGKQSETFRVINEVAVLSIITQPELTLSGKFINGPPSILLTTPGGTPIPGGNIYVAVNKENFTTVSTTTLTTNGDGIAVFNELILDVPDIDYQLSFSTGSSGVAAQYSDLFEVVAPLGLITISQQPLETVYGYNIAGPPSIIITETDGSPWMGDQIEINVSINKIGFESGTFTLNTLDGVAIFEDLFVNAIDNDYILTFSADISERIAPAVSETFRVVSQTGNLTIITQPSETVANDPINGPPTVRLTNLSGAPVPGVEVTVSLNKNDFTAGSTLTVNTNGQGYAIFNNLVIPANDTDYVITFSASASGIPQVQSQPFTITDPSLTMDVAEQPTMTTAGTSISPAPQVHIYNDSGNEAGVSVSIGINKNSFDASSTLTAVTDGDGIATFDNLIINTADENYILTFNANLSGVPNAHSIAFEVTAASPSYIVATSQPLNSVAGETINGTPAATLYDIFGNTVQGIDITVTPNQHEPTFSGTLVAESDENGIALFNDLVQTRAENNYQLFFTSPGVITGSSQFFAIINAEPDHINIDVQPSETFAGAAIEGPPTIRVVDEYDNPVQGETVTVTETGGYILNGGTTNIITNTNGNATFTDLIISSAGSYQLNFTAGDIQENSISFNVVQGTLYSRFYGGTHSGFIVDEVNDLPLGQTPVRIEIMSHPGESVVGNVLNGSPSVVVYDNFDQPVPSVSVTVSGAIFSAGETTLITNENGEISFEGLIIDITGTYQLSFTADDYPSVSAQTLPFDVIDALANMSITIQPQNSIAGQEVEGHPTVLIQNSIEMPMAGIDITVIINQYNFSAGSTITVTTNADGLAEFDELYISRAATGYQLIFSADYQGVQNIASASFHVTNAAADYMIVSSQPMQTLEGSSLAGPPAVDVYDEFDNPVAGVSVSVSETLAGINFDAGITTLTTNSAGSAVFSTLVINTRGTYQLTFASNNIPDVSSNTFQVVSGTVANRFKGSTHSGFISNLTEEKFLGQTPARIEIMQQPNETVAGFLVEGPPRIRVYDEVNNTVPNVRVNISLIGGAFSQGTFTLHTNSQGEATFGDLVIDTQGTYRLSFSAIDHTAYVNDKISNEFDVVGQVYTMSILSQPQNSIAGEHINGPPVVRIENYIYQPLTGVNVTVYVNQFGFASGSYTVATNEDGEAIFDNLVLNTAAEGYQLIFDANYSGLVNQYSDIFAVEPAAASQLVINTQPQTTIEGATINGPPNVTVRDEFNNPVPDILVSVAESSGYIFDQGTLSHTSDESGIVIFDNLVIDQMGQYSLIFSAEGPENVTSLVFNVTSGTVANRFYGNTHSGFAQQSKNEQVLGQQPTRFEIVTQPQETISGSTITGPPLVRLLDEADNPVGDVTVNVYIAGPGSPVFEDGSSMNVITNHDGEALFHNLLVGTIGTFTLIFEADRYDGIVPNAISQEFDVVNPLLEMQITQQPQETVAGETIEGPPSVRLVTTGSLQQPFAGIEITAYINQNGFASGTQTIITDTQGYAVFDDLIIEVAAVGYQIIFDADIISVPNIPSNSFTVTPAPAEYLSIISEPQDSQANTVIEGPPSVALFDAFNNPVADTHILLTEAGGYSIDTGTLIHTTGTNGQVDFNDIQIATPGFYMFNFSADAPGVGDIQSQQFRILSGEMAGRFRGSSHSGFTQDEEKEVLLQQIPTYIEVLTQPQQTVSGSFIQGPPRVAVYDQLYMPVSNSLVTVFVTGGTTPPLSGSLTKSTNEQGEIVFDDLLISEIGLHQLNFIVGGYPLVFINSEYFEVILPLMSMELHQQPQDVVAGEIIGGFPSVIIRDELNNGVENIEVSVNLNQFGFASDPINATAITNASGIAVFDQLVIEMAADFYQMIFVADSYGISNVNSDYFTVFPAQADHISIITQPQTSISGSAIEGPPAVVLNDGYNNSIPGYEITVTVSGGETLAGTTNINTDESGVAHFTNLVINNPGIYNLIFDATDADAVTSFGFMVVSGQTASRYRGNTHSGFTGSIIQNQELQEKNPVEAPVFDNPITDLCEAGEHNLSATALYADSIHYTINPAAFGSISETGNLVLNAGYSGQLNITAIAYGFEGPQETTLQVNVLPNADMPVFEDPVLGICQGEVETQYQATINQPGSISYSVSPADAGAMDAATGMMTWDAAFTGLATITATATAANGCGDPESASIEVLVGDEITDPVFIQGATELCQDSPNETYLAVSENALSITYSINLGTAGTLNQETGVMNWAPDFHGTVTITATANGCGGPKTTERIVTVHPLPVTSAISGEDAVECEAQGVVYSVELTPQSTYIWSVPDGAAILSGEIGPENNSIIIDFGQTNGYISVVEITEHGCSGQEISMLITLKGCDMQAYFDASATYICEGEGITFTDLSTGQDIIDNWLWEFEGGMPSTASSQGPHTVIFSKEGTYEVSLTVYDGIASDTYTTEVDIDRHGRWLGAVDSDWTNNQNWSCALIPGSSNNITIEHGVDYFPVIPEDVSVNNLTIANGAEISIINNSTLNIYGNWVNDGIFNYNTSTVSFHNTNTVISGSAYHSFSSIHVQPEAGLSTLPATLTISGDFIVEGSYNHVNRALNFTGNAEQKISGSAGELNLCSLIVNKSGGHLTLERRVDINCHLQLEQGMVMTSMVDESMIRIKAGASANEGNNNAFIDGPIQKRGGTAFTFPTGSGNIWAPIEISASGIASELFQAQYFFTGHPEAEGNYSDGIVNVSDTEYWDLSRIAGTTLPDVTLHFKNMARSGISIPEDILYVHWQDGEWNNMAQGINIISENVGSITATGFTSFSPHTIGSSSADALPIELLSFTAVAGHGKILTEWITAAEINNDYFTLEKSLDGEYFEMVAQIQGAGTVSSPRKYTYTDHQPYHGLSYYRLTQTDFDGTSETFPMVSVYLEPDSLETILEVFPNPVKTSGFNISLTNVGHELFTLHIIDEAGRTIFSNEFEGESDTRWMRSSDELAISLKPGLYLIMIKQTHNIIMEKLIVY